MVEIRALERPLSIEEENMPGETNMPTKMYMTIMLMWLVPDTDRPNNTYQIEDLTTPPTDLTESEEPNTPDSAVVISETLTGTEEEGLLETLMSITTDLRVKITLPAEERANCIQSITTVRATEEWLKEDTALTREIYIETETAGSEILLVEREDIVEDTEEIEQNDTTEGTGVIIDLVLREEDSFLLLKNRISMILIWITIM